MRIVILDRIGLSSTEPSLEEQVYWQHHPFSSCIFFSWRVSLFLIQYVTLSLVIRHSTSFYCDWEVAGQYKLSCSGFRTSLYPSTEIAQVSWAIVFVQCFLITELKLQTKFTYLILITWDLINRPAPEKRRNILDIWVEKIYYVLVLRKLLFLFLSGD